MCSHYIKVMSIEAFTKFLDGNPEVAKTVAACKNYNEVAEIAKANNFNVTGAELTRYAAEQTAELSDADLEAVAGGSWTGSSGGEPVTTAVINGPQTVNTIQLSPKISIPIK